MHTAHLISTRLDVVLESSEMLPSIPISLCIRIFPLPLQDEVQYSRANLHPLRQLPREIRHHNQPLKLAIRRSRHDSESTGDSRNYCCFFLLREVLSAAAGGGTDA